MSFKNIDIKSQKAQSLDDRPIKSSQHSKLKKSMADQLRGQIKALFQKQEDTITMANKSVEWHEFYLAKGPKYQSESEFQWCAYQTYTDEVHRLGEEIQVKMKAVKKYESPKKMEGPKIINTKKQQLKYGPSDEEE